jgi:hypothetical protein
MAGRERDKTDAARDAGDTDGRDGLWDEADMAQQQMPGKPPNLTYDPSKRIEELSRKSGDEALEDALRKRENRRPPD